MGAKVPPGSARGYTPIAMPIDVERARRDTPGCAQVIHFNNAGAALTPRPVLDAVIGHLELEARIGGYEAADRQGAAVERVYDAAAALLGCGRDEIAHRGERDARLGHGLLRRSASAPATAS